VPLPETRCRADCAEVGLAILRGKESRGNRVVSPGHKFHIDRRGILLAARRLEALNVSFRKLDHPRRSIANFDEQRLRRSMRVQCQLPRSAGIDRFRGAAEFEEYGRNKKLPRVSPSHGDVEGRVPHGRTESRQNHERDR